MTPTARPHTRPAPQPSVQPAIQTVGLGKRYGQSWGLRDCTVEVPRGAISSLLGPNGSGKTTLLRMIAGFAAPSAGDVYVLGRKPEQNAEFLASVGYLAQEMPLYRRLNVAEHLDLGRHLNPRWDDDAARQRLKALRVPFDRPVATLSGGQKAQVALAVALAKRPDVLVLDEPVAALDPLARAEFLGSLVEAVAGAELTVVLSSHLLRDVEQVCDHVVLLASSRVLLCANTDSLFSSHKVLVGPRRGLSECERTFVVVEATHTERQSRLLVRTEFPVRDPSWEVFEPDLQEIVLAYMGQDRHSATISAGALRLIGSAAGGDQ
jgi:ABC-2 type transport system ATP-binding protein